MLKPKSEADNISGIVVAANFNSPGQVVISGEIDAVNSAMTAAKENGARMVIPLNVSGAFHSPLMTSAREQLTEMINSIETYLDYFSSSIDSVDNIEDAVRIALNQVVGAYAIVVISKQEPEKLIAARLSSPLVIGIGKEEFFVASDPSPFIEHTKKAIYFMRYI